MWIDETYRHLKSQGFHVDKAHIWDWRTLSRLFLALLALLYVWSMAFGWEVIKSGWHHLVGRRYRRGLMCDHHPEKGKDALPFRGDQHPELVQSHV